MQPERTRFLDSPGELRVHSIETFGTHDGPGIRMVVFVQGCQLRCAYCANPDTIDINGGRMMDLEELMELAINEKPYFGRKGGVTVSGGEPTLQRSKLIPLFKMLHEEGINTALDTNGKILDEEVKELFDETDYLLLDIKHFDEGWHRKLTERSNKKVLDTAAYRESTGKAMWLRYVLVPGWSDQEEHLHAMGHHFKDYKTIEKVQILPYHQLGVHKWKALGMPYRLEGVEPPTREQVEKAAAIFRQYFGSVRIG